MNVSRMASMSTTYGPYSASVRERISRMVAISQSVPNCVTDVADDVWAKFAEEVVGLSAHPPATFPMLTHSERGGCRVRKRAATGRAMAPVNFYSPLLPRRQKKADPGCSAPTASTL